MAVLATLLFMLGLYVIGALLADQIVYYIGSRRGFCVPGCLRLDGGRVPEGAGDHRQRAGLKMLYNAPCIMLWSVDEDDGI